MEVSEMLAGRGSEKRLLSGESPRISNRNTAIRNHRKPLKIKGRANF
jgi:hypothetical protein